MRRWAECRVHTHPEAAEAISHLLTELGAGGVVLDQPDDATLFVCAYFPDDQRLQERLEQVRQALEALPRFGLQAGPGRVQLRWVDEEDWAHSWKAHFRPQPVGRKLLIRPSWEPGDLWPGRLTICLDPGMAFGTGYHPTTRLCLEWLEGLLRGEETCADIGTGSGILAIAAAKLGASRVYAADIDPLAVEIAAENARINGVQDRVRVLQGSAAQVLAAMQSAGLPGAQVVVANLTAQILQELGADLAALVAPGGRLVASGIVEERADQVVRLLESWGLEPVGRRVEQGWVAQLWRRRERM